MMVRSTPCADYKNGEFDYQSTLEAIDACIRARSIKDRNVPRETAGRFRRIRSTGILLFQRLAAKDSRARVQSWADKSPQCCAPR